MSVDGAGRWRDALSAAALVAVDPRRLGGLVLRTRPSAVRDRWLGALRCALPATMPLRRLPPGIGDDRLLGGLDLAATLRAGRPVAQRGLLAEAHGGIVLVPMAERLAPGLAARLSAVLDQHAIAAEREGLTLRAEAAVALVLIDESASDDEAVPARLAERLAFTVSLEGLALADTAAAPVTAGEIACAQAALPAVATTDRMVEALVAAAAALGVASLRAPLFALAAARASAALAGRSSPAEEDLARAARLVLAPRATRLPAEAEPERDEADDPPDAEPDRGPQETRRDGGDDDRHEQDAAALADLVLQAASAAVPPGLLAALAAGKARQAGAAAGRQGAERHSMLRGAPVAARPGLPRGGARLALLDTLRAAAPWQRLRRREGGPVIAVKREDLRVRRYRERSETTTIFVVDASGSAALARLAEAKGAVELLLAECYVRRDRVALIAFRGPGAELVLPPTSSLVRARRSLAGLPGGGGTPLAAALDSARGLAEAVLRRGGTPLIVLLTDGRANVARDGTGGRDRATRDAHDAARALASLRVAAVLIDTATRPQAEAQALAAAMGARYQPLPYADAAALSRAVKAARPREAAARAA